MLCILMKKNVLGWLEWISRYRGGNLKIIIMSPIFNF